ncbi:MAG: ROK family protein [Planctomycetota bacterium]|nr:ROK family protein [Planctomycetota bacterium]
MMTVGNPPKGPFYVGIDLGGTNIKAGVVDDAGQPISHVSLPTEADKGPGTGLWNLEKAGRMAVKEAGMEWSGIAAVGLGSPGTMDLRRGWLLEPPNLPGWENLPIRDLLAKSLEKPTILQNDANAAAYGEFWAGAGRGSESLVLFTLGTGVGGGVIEHGRIIEGRNSAGSECGHIIIDFHENARLCPCGQRGHLEAYASATALVKRAREGIATGIDTMLTAIDNMGQLSARSIDEAAQSGDSFSIRLMDETAYYLAVGAVSLMNVIDPDMILFSGGMIAAGERFLTKIQNNVKRLAFPVPGSKCKVEFAQLGNNAGFIGAAGWARAVVTRKAQLD